MTQLWHHNFCEVAIVIGPSALRIRIASASQFAYQLVAIFVCLSCTFC